MKPQEKAKELKETKCFLLIIPFTTLEETQTKIPDVKYFARNVLEVDDEYYERILLDYKKWKKEAIKIAEEK